MKQMIPEYVTRVLNALTDVGHEAYLVGGCVRDAALGKTPHDFDATTSALPEEMLKIFADFRVIETGLKHGTLTVMSDGEPVEVTTYRVDGEYLDNRHPSEVRFTRNITEDLSRRDFTVNAMAYSLRDGLCDPFGGMSHLKERQLICVGSPEARFDEDGLRILRALRFSSVLDFEIASETSAAIKKMYHLLDNISRERIYSEIKKLICGDGARRIMTLYPEVLARCIGGTDADTFVRAVDVSELQRDPVVRLAHVIRKAPGGAGNAVFAMKSLKASVADIKRCSGLAIAAESSYPETDADVRRLMGVLDERDILAYAELRAAETGDEEDGREFISKYRMVAADGPCVRVSDLAVNGKDVMDATGKKGAEIGKALADLLEDVIERRIPNERDALIARLAERDNI